MPNIWRVRPENKFDLSDTARWGDLVTIYDDPDPDDPEARMIGPHDVVRQLGKLRAEILPASHRDDMILITGPQIMVSTLVAAWVAHYGSVRLLVWNNRKKEYRRIILDGKDLS